MASKNRIHGNNQEILNYIYIYICGRGKRTRFDLYGYATIRLEKRILFGASSEAILADARRKNSSISVWFRASKKSSSDSFRLQDRAGLGFFGAGGQVRIAGIRFSSDVGFLQSSSLRRSSGWTASGLLSAAAVEAEEAEDSEGGEGSMACNRSFGRSRKRWILVDMALANLSA